MSWSAPWADLGSYEYGVGPKRLVARTSAKDRRTEPEDPSTPEVRPAVLFRTVEGDAWLAVTFSMLWAGVGMLRQARRERWTPWRGFPRLELRATVTEADEVELVVTGNPPPKPPREVPSRKG